MQLMTFFRRSLRLKHQTPRVGQQECIPVLAILPSQLSSLLPEQAMGLASALRGTQNKIQGEKEKTTAHMGAACLVHSLPLLAWEGGSAPTDQGKSTAVPGWCLSPELLCSSYRRSRHCDGHAQSGGLDLESRSLQVKHCILNEEILD